MSYLQAVISGVVQGLTEFLPISSSAHLVLLQYLLNWQLDSTQAFVFNVLVQLGTLAAVIFYFRRDLFYIGIAFIKGIIKGRPFAAYEARLGWLIIIATIPAGLIGYFFQDQVEAAFTSPLFAGVALLVTALIMFIAEKVSFQIGEMQETNLLDAIVMGLAQALAIFPGISRSGITISGGMIRHLRRDTAGKFSFLMSIPIMLAAGGLSAYNFATTATLSEWRSFLPIMIIGFLTAMIVGYVSIRWLLTFITKHSLIYFSVYCALLGSAAILISQIFPNGF